MVFSLYYISIKYVLTFNNSDSDNSQCSINPCRNGGKCLSRIGGYLCQCLAGYTGSNCQSGMSLAMNCQLSVSRVLLTGVS